MSKTNKLTNLLLQNAVSQKEGNEDAIKKQLVVKEELRLLIPPLKDEEFNQLEANILKEGCREPLLYWYDETAKEYILVDGHNRYAICQKHTINFSLKALSLNTEAEVKMWMVTNQLGRRNLTTEQQSYFRGKQYEMQKALITNPFGKKGAPSELVVKMTTNSDDIDGGQNDHHQTVDKTFELVVKMTTNSNDIDSGQNDHQQTVDKTSKLLAQTHKVGEKTIRRDALFAKGIDRIGESNPILKQDILSGKIKVKKETLQNLGSLTDYTPIQTLSDIEKQLLPKTTFNSTSTSKLSEALKQKSKEAVKVTITGQWLLDNDLVSYWQKVRKINKVIDADFEDILSWQEAKDIFKG